jgi:hypothetical protein
MLWAKLQSLESTLRFLKEQQQACPKDIRQLEHLLCRLTEAGKCIQKLALKKRPRFLLGNHQFWGLVHGVSADLLLLMPLDMLASEALVVESHFRRNIREPIARATWLGQDGESGPLCQAIQLVRQLAEKPTKDLPLDHEPRLRHARQVLRRALEVVNKSSDRYHRQLTHTLLVRTLSGSLLVGLFLVALGFQLPEQFTTLILAKSQGNTQALSPLSTLAFILLGAGGAVAANMLSERPILTTKGPDWGRFVYHLFIKPSIGAVAAFIFYLLAISQLLFSIEGPRRDQAFTDGAPRVQPQVQQTPPVRIALGTETALVCTYALLFIAVGFSAERRLGPTMDKVLNGLAVTPEKHEASGPGPVKPAPPASQELPS